MTDDPYAEPVLTGDEIGKTVSRKGCLFTVFGGLAFAAVLATVFIPATRNVRETARRAQCKNNLKQIALALRNYHDEYESFPPAYTVDEHGRRLHSWRTLILPYMDQQRLYNQIDLTKPWDDPANLAVAKEAPNEYRCPSAAVPTDFTTYSAVAGEHCVFHPTEGRAIREITDGTSNTLLVVELSPDNAINWMSPEDRGGRFFLTFGDDTELAHLDGTQVAVADGSVRFVPSYLHHETRRALITAEGDDVVGEW